jgi:rhodanese-related sulfurtransferase
VRLDSAIEQAGRKGKKIAALRAGGEEIESDLILITAGVRPRTEIFVAAGGQVERDGSICVDDRCATSLDDVYATSICVSHTHAVTRKPIWTAQASDADKTAQVAGANAAGGDARLGPTLGTAITRAGQLHLARTGLTQQGGRQAVARIQIAGHSCDPFFRGSEPLELTLYYSPKSERVLGAEVIGRAGVDKRIDVIATAILGKLTLTQLAGLDLAYSPPYSMVRDIVNAAGIVALQAQHVHAWTIEAFREHGDDVVVYDLRSAAQRKAQKFSATPLDIAKLREHQAALAKAKQVVFVCETGRESYLAARAASQLGCHDAGYLSGGLQAWREASGR